MAEPSNSSTAGTSRRESRLRGFAPAAQPGEGLQQSFGAWRKDDAGLEDFLKAVYRDRDDNPAGNVIPS